MKRSFSVERLFPLGDYKNVKFFSSAELDLDNPEDAKAFEEMGLAGGIVEQLTKDTYQGFFNHSRRLAQMTGAKTTDEQEKAFMS